MFKKLLKWKLICKMGKSFEVYIKDFLVIFLFRFDLEVKKIRVVSIYILYRFWFD